MKINKKFTTIKITKNHKSKNNKKFNIIKITKNH